MKVGPPPNKKSWLRPWKDIYSYYSEHYSLRLSRFIALAFLSFAGFLRFNEAAKIQFKDLKIFEKYFTVFIPKSKTDIYGNGTIIYISRNGSDACPNKLLKLYLAMTKDWVGEDFIFRSIVTKGRNMVLNPISYGNGSQDFKEYFSKI